MNRILLLILFVSIREKKHHTDSSIYHRIREKSFLHICICTYKIILKMNKYML